jgi:hypothetical protein
MARATRVQLDERFEDRVTAFEQAIINTLLRVGQAAGLEVTKDNWHTNVDFIDGAYKALMAKFFTRSVERAEEIARKKVQEMLIRARHAVG